MSYSRKEIKAQKKKFKAFLKYLEVHSIITTHEHGDYCVLTLPRNSSIEVVRGKNHVRVLIDETVL